MDDPTDAPHRTPPRPSAEPASGRVVGSVAILDVVIVGLGACAGLALVVGTLVLGPSLWRMPVVWGWALVVVAAGLLVLHGRFERRAGLAPGMGERFRWLDAPQDEAAHDASLARSLPPWARGLRPLAHGLLVTAWIVWVALR